MVFIFLAITLLTLFCVFFNVIKDYADDYSDFMKSETELAIFLFMIVFLTSTPFCIPATFFIIIGSFIFGRTFGFLYGFLIFWLVDYICQMIGVYLAFLNGRYLFRKHVQSWIQSRPKLIALSEALTNNAKKLVFLLRISNLTPYDILHNFFSLLYVIEEILVGRIMS